MKLKLDENLSQDVAALLRQHGFDVSTVLEQSLSGTPDENLFRVCVDEGRALVTLDHDFGEVLRFSPASAHGIAILELGSRPSLQSMLNRATELAAFLKVHFIAGSLWIVEPGRVRIHLADDRDSD